MSDDLMSELQALDKEYGFTPVPDSVYHVALDENSKVVEGKNGNTDAFRLGWRIVCGGQEKRVLSDFLRWFPSNPDKRNDKDAVRIARGMAVQALKAITMSLPTEDQARILPAVSGLRNAATPEEANGYFVQIAQIARATRLYVRAKTTPAKDPKTGQVDTTKDGFQNLSYLEKGNPISAICTCITEAVAV